MYRLRYPLINALDRRVRAFLRALRSPIRIEIYMNNEDNGCERHTIVCRYGIRHMRDACTRIHNTRVRATRENTIKAAPGKNTNLNGTKEICSHIRCIRMNGARLLQFTIYCFATFFSADASGIRSLLPVFSLPPPQLSRLSRALALFLALESPDTRQKKQRGKAGERGREWEYGDGRAERSGR